MHIRPCLAAVAIAVVHSATSLDAVTVPLSIGMDGRIGVAVRINGSGPYRFRVDTGASRSVVSERLAHRLGLAAHGATRTITQTGETRFSLVQLQDVRLSDGATLPALMAAIVPDAALDPARQVDGLLGQDALAAGPYSLDYRSAQLTLGPEATASPAGVRLPLASVAGSWLVVVSAAGRGRPLRLLPDSGADRVVLFGPSAAALPSMTILEPVRVRSIAGERPARLVRLHTLHLGALRLRDSEAVWIDRPSTSAVMGDGLLPLRLFARVTFNRGGGYLELEPWN